MYAFMNYFRVMYYTAPGFLVTIFLAVVEGVIAYSYYHVIRCDPLESKTIKNSNQVKENFISVKTLIILVKTRILQYWTNLVFKLKHFLIDRFIGVTPM